MNCNPCCGCLPPITTYNPSVADNFPTILQQVEYLKALLKKYPSQQWFITQEKVTEETKYLNKLSILSNGREPQGGDFILGNKENGTILLFQYTGVITEYVNYNLIYVGVFTNQGVAEALEKARTAQTTANNALNAAQVASTEAQAADTKAQNAQSAAQAADTKAQNALDLATTNETDIGTLDGQVAQIETNLNNKQDKITKTTNLSCRKIQTDSLSFTMELGSDSTEYDYGLLFASKTMVSTGQLKPSFKDENFFEWVLPAKSGTLATTDDIRVVSSIEVTLTPAGATRGTLTDEQLATLLLNDNCYIKHNGIIYTLFKRSDTVLQYTAGYLNDTKNIQNIKALVNLKAWTIENIALPQAKIYKHHVKIVIDDLIYDKEFTGNAYIDIISSNNLTVASVTDIKTLLGDTFITNCYGFANVEAEGQKIVYEANQNSISCQGYQIPWSAVTITDTVTTI